MQLNVEGFLRLLRDAEAKDGSRDGAGEEVSRKGESVVYAHLNRTTTLPSSDDERNTSRVVSSRATAQDRKRKKGKKEISRRVARGRGAA
jgi:hypothetical protein